MRPVRRDEILDWATYGDQRDALRAQVLAAKDLRRVHVGAYLTFLFENPLTVRYQVLEMVRAERIVREADIRHELDTYNELLGGPGELGATLLVEIESPEERERLLTRWLDVPARTYLRFDDGARVHATVDERQQGRGRLSSVQYLKFAAQGRAPRAVGCDHPEIAAETELTAAQRAALRADLEESA